MKHLLILLLSVVTLASCEVHIHEDKEDLSNLTVTFLEFEYTDTQEREFFTVDLFYENEKKPFLENIAVPYGEITFEELVPGRYTLGYVKMSSNGKVYCETEFFISEGSDKWIDIPFEEYSF